MAQHSMAQRSTAAAHWVGSNHEDKIVCGPMHIWYSLSVRYSYQCLPCTAFVQFNPVYSNVYKTWQSQTLHEDAVPAQPWCHCAQCKRDGCWGGTLLSPTRLH